MGGVGWKQGPCLIGPRMLFFSVIDLSPSVDLSQLGPVQKPNTYLGGAGELEALHLTGGGASILQQQALCSGTSFLPRVNRPADGLPDNRSFPSAGSSFLTFLCRPSPKLPRRVFVAPSPLLSSQDPCEAERQWSFAAGQGFGPGSARHKPDSQTTATASWRLCNADPEYLQTVDEANLRGRRGKRKTLLLNLFS